MQAHSPPVIRVQGLCQSFAGQVVHQQLSLQIDSGEIVALIGESGCGKTSLLRAMLMLQKPQAGQIDILGIDIMRATEEARQNLRVAWGVMFQSAALFASMTVLENVMFPIQVHSKAKGVGEEETALLFLDMVGLQRSAATKMPAELSGGMRKRVALARALVMQPQLLILDEPSAGLDPQSADAFDDLLLQLHDKLDLTILLVTHDLDMLWRVPTRTCFLGEGSVLASGSLSELMRHPNEAIRSYFSNARARRFVVKQPEGGFSG